MLYENMVTTERYLVSGKKKNASFDYAALYFTALITTIYPVFTIFRYHGFDIGTCYTILLLC